MANLAARLADERHRLDELHVGDLDARSSFALSYRDLDTALAMASRVLSVIPTTATRCWNWRKQDGRATRMKGHWRYMSR